MMRYLTLIVLCVTLGFCHNAVAQNAYQEDLKPKKYYHSLQLSLENGAMLSNDTEFGDQIVNSSYYNGLDLRYGWSKLDPEETYNRVYRHPTLGIGWYASTFHSAEVGKPHALYFYMTMPFAWEAARKWTFSYTGAFGLSYNFNPYDSINNPTNIFVGSYRNCYVHLGLNVNYQFNNRVSAFGSAGFKHFSNGSFKLPNYGINLVPVALGVRYKFIEEEVRKPDAPLEKFIPHNQYNVMLAFGSKNYEIGDPNYLKMTLGLNYLRQINYKYRVGVGMDFFYAAQSDLRNTSEESDFSKSFSYAVVGSWEWVITRKVFIPIGIGYYLHRNVENGEKESHYERVGIRYRIKDHYNLGLTIKAHGGVADMFEWTMVYTLHKDPNKYR